MVTPITVQPDETSATALSYFTIYRTPPSDSSQLFAVGRYEDRFLLEDGAWRLASRRALVDTEMLPRFTHFPL